ncbi:BatA domain-containing protein [Fulvivirga lutea]|uniref:BatA domain-containing protein n=1 Tax=Fulvivirga lutea TaxID=2810512 RepID=A0A974ZZX9_9BACT|nr:BatA domain-containing protein [Fulvivirga lutea]QSE96625.1 BatA domain-containing protein [Fulvivirga lutea]
MEFANASYLYGLFGLLIPIAIHLWSKKEGKVIHVGSLKYIPEFETKQSKSIKLNELLLLMVRCLVLSLFCFLMAELLTTKKVQNTNAIVLVEPTLFNDSRVQKALDTLKIEKRYLNSGLELIDDQKANQEAVDIWDAFDAINKLPADTIFILASVTENQLKGRRPATSKVIKWLPIEPLENQEYTHRSFTNGLDLIATSNTISTEYKWVEGVQEAMSQAENWDTLKFDIVYDQEFEKELFYFQSALATISEVAKRPILINSFSTKNFENKGSDWLIWLSEDELNFEHNASSLIYRENVTKPILTGQSGRYFLNNRITQDNFISEDFIGHLFAIIIPEKADLKESRQVPLEMVKLNQSTIDTDKTNKARADWFWLVFLGFFLFERVYSMKRKQ